MKAVTFIFSQVPRLDSLENLHSALAASKADKTPLALFFFVEWCGPCRRFAPTFAALRSEFPSISFCCADADKVPDIAEIYQVMNNCRVCCLDFPFKIMTSNIDLPLVSH